jgi:predicted transcriptional regulator
MYKARISWVTLTDILNTLHAEEFIRIVRENNAKRYFLTERGRDLLAYNLKPVEGLVSTH